VNYRI